MKTWFETHRRPTGDDISLALICLGFLVLLVVAVLLATHHGGAPGSLASSIRQMPASRHVTGVYPQSCALGASNGRGVPDHSCTPGGTDAEVLAPGPGTPGNFSATICAPGWSSQAKALDGELTTVMTQATAAYGVHTPATLNWLIPLNLGGSNDVSNLFVLPVADAGAKQAVDATVNKAVCAGTTTLTAAQNAMSTNWTTATQVLGLGG